MAPTEQRYIPYAPASRVVDIIRRAREGRLPDGQNTQTLARLGVPEGNADRVLKAVQFLSILDEDGDRTPTTQRLQAASTEEYPAVLLDVLRGAYREIFAVYPDPAQATDIQLEDAFRLFTPAGQRKNMVTLFRALCREAGLNIAGPSPSAGTSRAARRSMAKETKGRQPDRPAEPAEATRAVPSVSSGRDPVEQALVHLIRMLPFGSTWTKSQRDHWVMSLTSLIDYAIPEESDEGGE